MIRSEDSSKDHGPAARTDGQQQSKRGISARTGSKDWTVMWGFGIAVAEGGDHGSTWLTIVKPSR